MKYVFFFLLNLAFIDICTAQKLDSLVISSVKKAEFLRKEKNEFDTAIEVLMSTLNRIIKDEKFDEIQIAPLYHKIGVNYYFKGDMIRALKFNSIALEIRENYYGFNQIDVIRGYFNQGSIYRNIQDYFESKKSLKQAILGMEQLIDSGQSNDTRRLMNMYLEMFRVNNLLKDFSTALSYWNLVFDYHRQKEMINIPVLADLYTNKGIVYALMDNHDSAIDCYNNSLKLLNSSNKNHEILKGTIFHNLAKSQQSQKKYSPAEESYFMAINLFNLTSSKSQELEVSQRLGNTYTDLVNLCAQTREWNEGKQYYDLALKYTTEGWGTFFHPRLAELYRNRTRLSLGQGHFEESLVFNQKSLQALLPDLKTDDPFVSVNLNEHGIKNKNSLLETLNQKAEIFMAKYEKGSGADLKYLDAAFRNFKTLDTLITQIRQSYEAQGSQFELIEQTYPIYEKAITTALELFEKKQDFRYLESAYHFAAKNKAMVLLAGMQEEEAKVYSSIPEALKSTEKNLKRSIFQLESKIYQQAGATSDPGLRDSLFVLKRNYQKLIDRFELEHPDYYDLKYRFDKTISVEKLQSQMLQGHSVIEYFVGDDAIFIFTITKNNFNYESFSKPEEFDQILERFRNSMENPRNAENLFADSYQIYEWLVKPSLEKVAGETAIEHLTFIPDGPLLQLSFDVLITAPFEQIPYYLLQKYPISYAYSNRLLFDDISRESAPNTFAGFGLEYDDYTLTDLATYVNNPMSSLPLSRALGPLLFSDDEVKEISELLDGHTWINEAATREAFLENAGDYAILHLATHGVLNERYPMNSALIFTRQNDSTDYFLRAADLYGMELKAEMTVLSACNTGNGIVERGEGVRSLARAFATAGCPSLVASLWNASDASTKKILVSFYENLEKGQTKAEAMRQAKLAYLEKAPPTYRAPYYWSHLSVIGESGELDVLNKPWWRKYWYLWAAGMGIAGALVASRWKAAA